MTERIGVDEAKAIGDQHEQAGDRGKQPAKEKAMDMANNAVGRSCGAQGNKLSCNQRCTDSYNGGGLFGLGGAPMPGPRKR